MSIELREKKPTKLQIRAFEIIKQNPAMPLYKALVLAGYARKNAIGHTGKIVGSKGMESLQNLYKYEIVRKGVTPKFLAKKLKDGLKDKDKKTALAYLQEAQRALDISTDVPDVAIQVNLSPDLEEYAK